MNVDIIGGGPAGLYLALLLSHQPTKHRVRVLEQNSPGATYGFGVSLADAALSSLRDADEVSYSRMIAAMSWLEGHTIDNQGAAVRLDVGRPAGSIERIALLRILEQECARAGVEVVHSTAVARLERPPCDKLLVGADGANSAVRAAWADEFGPTTSLLGNRFAWYGVKSHFVTPTLAFRRTGEGAFVGHYYGYASERSTFVAECDRATWDAGFGELSDDARKTYFERLFESELGGRKLVENRSIWRQFTVVECARWSIGNVVLIGDALRPAHFSIGSGTRLAMEDAIALADAINRAPSLPAVAAAAFEENRRPSREKLNRAAERSYCWYEDFGRRLDQSGWDFAYDFLTRTGRLDDDRLRRDFPSFMNAYDRHRKARV